MEYWNIGIIRIIKFGRIISLHYSIIPLFLKVILITSLLLPGCAGTERFEKEESYSKSKDKENNAIMETVKGVASYYSDEFHGKKTANGETYNMYELTAAHKTYPFNTKVRVTNISNDRSVILRINDRMPSYNKRLIDVSFQAARELEMIISGTANVKIEVLSWGDEN